MAAIEIGQLPLTTAVVDLTQLPVENANVTQKIEATSLKSYMTTLPVLAVAGNITGANLNITGRIDSQTVTTTGIITGSVLVSTVSDIAPLNVTSSIQVPNLYASRAAIADATTNGLTTASIFANTSITDAIISGNNSTISATLRTINANVGTFGNTLAVPQLTVDAKGRITAVSNITITFPSQTLISNTAEITANTTFGTPGLNLTTTGVTAGTYGGAVSVPQITVDAKGRITNLSSIPVNSTLNTLNLGIPVGTIAMWSGPLNTVPDGWQIADGTNGTIDLRNRFVVGAGNTYAPGATGGSADSIVPAHTHTATSTSTFTGAALGTHSHGVTDNGHTHTVTNTGGAHNAAVPGGNYAAGSGFGGTAQGSASSTSTTGISIQAQSAGTPSGTVATSTSISTQGSSATNANLPPYYALYYIQKITDAVSINNPINYMATTGNIISGGNIVAASGNASVSTTTGALVVVGGAGVGGNLNVGGPANFNSNVSVSGSLIAATVPTNTANTHVATTAFVNNRVGTLGTMSAQNANGVAITGGTISGLSAALPIASGGTGLTTIGTSGQVLTSDGTNASWTTPAVQASVGVGQTWQNLAGSRALGTTYTNSTGRPIQVIACVRVQSSGNQALVYVNEVLVAQTYTIDCCGAPQISFMPLSFIVPNGATYRITGNSGFTTWSELR
jgi:hypothetical protein